MSKPDFRTFLREAARNKEMVAEFDRLTGSNLSQRPQPPIIQAIDLATGKLADDLVRFLNFALDMWQRMPNDDGSALESAAELARGEEGNG